MAEAGPRCTSTYCEGVERVGQRLRLDPDEVHTVRVLEGWTKV